MASVKEAHSRYRSDQEKQQRQQQLLKDQMAVDATAKSLAENQQIMIEKEDKLIAEQKCLQLELDKAAKVVAEGNTLLAAAVVHKNVHDVEVTQLLISNASKKLDTFISSTYQQYWSDQSAAKKSKEVKVKWKKDVKVL